MTATSLTPILTEMAGCIRERRMKNPLVVGIHTGGEWIAEFLHRDLGIESALGSIDISFYRDDFSRVGLNPKVQSSNLPEPVDNRHILLVDDVLHTGRTIRAALNEIFSYGRPASVTLAVALERSGRELPIQADVVGKSIDAGADEQAQVSIKGNEIVYEIVSASPPLSGKDDRH